MSKTRLAPLVAVMLISLLAPLQAQAQSKSESV